MHEHFIRSLLIYSYLPIYLAISDMFVAAPVDTANHYLKMNGGPFLSQNEIEAKIRRLLAENLRLEEATLTADTRLMEDLHLDSFGATEALFIIEDAFQLSLQDLEFHKIGTLRDVANYVFQAKFAQYHTSLG